MSMQVGLRQHVSSQLLLLSWFGEEEEELGRMDPVRRERHEVPPLTPTGRALVVYFALIQE